MKVKPIIATGYCYYHEDTISCLYDPYEYEYFIYCKEQVKQPSQNGFIAYCEDFILEDIGSEYEIKIIEE